MIRPAEIGDVPAIADLWNWMIRETLATFTTELKSVAAIEGMLKQRPDAFFIAEEAGDLSGFVTFGPFRAGPGYAKTCEHSVVVPPGGQNRGIGSDLMRRAMHAADRSQNREKQCRWQQNFHDNQCLERDQRYRGRHFHLPFSG